MLLFRLLKCFYFQNKQLDEIPDKTHSIPFLLWSYLPSRFVFHVGNSTEGQRVCNMSPIKSGQLQKNPCSINGFMTDQRATAKTSLINCSEGGDWQTPEYSSYFCRIRSRERLYNLHLYPDSQPDHSVPYMLLILLLFPLCSVIWMLLYLFKKKKKCAIIPFYSFLSFSSLSSVQKVSPNTFLDTSKHTCSSFTRRQPLSVFLAYHQLTMYSLFSCLLKSPISYQEELRFTPKILHIFLGKQVFTASLRDLCIQFYFLLIGTPASSTTTNTVLPGQPSSLCALSGCRLHDWRTSCLSVA